MEILFAFFAVVFPGELSPESTIEMEDQVEYAGARAPAVAEAGEKVPIELYFKVAAPLPERVSNFLHLESPAGSDCRVVHDRAPEGVRDGVLVHEVEVRMPDRPECIGTKLRLYTGLYDTESGARYRVKGLTVGDNRIPAATIALVSSSAEDSQQLASFSPADVRWRQFVERSRPWWGWLGGLGIAIALAALLRRWRVSGGRADEEGEPNGWNEPVDAGEWWVRGATALVAVPTLLGILAALNFVKDDAYISFRYAHNLVTGDGLVFNPGEYVEGFTNFLWVFVIAPFEALELDLFQVTELLGTALVLGTLYVMARTNDHLMEGPRRDLARIWAPLWVGTSSSVALWTTSGMEQPLAMLLPVAGLYLLWTCGDDRGATGRAALAGAILGLGCLTRPEIHLIGIIAGLPLAWRMVRERSLDPVAAFWALGLLAVTVPAHAFRLWYFGSLLPNTFYVKTGGGTVVLLEGLRQLHDLFEFNGVGFATLLVPFAFLERRHLREKLVMVGVAAGFMAYTVWVGDDEMTWYRLYLPALPFLALLAGVGLRNLCAAAAAGLEWRGGRRLAVYGAGWAVVLAAAGTNFAFTYDRKDGFNGRGRLSGSYHPDLGKFLTRHARPGSLVAFQDMGSTPYHAPDLKFLDFIGLVDETVARARHRYGLHAFVPTGTPERRSQYNAEMREYFHRRSPEWAILTSYIPGGEAQEVSEQFSRRPVPATLEPWIGRNRYQFGIYDQKFKERYRHVRTWPKSAGYYLSLFVRRDLWEGRPGEVVLGVEGDREVGPEEFGGVRASFEGGLEMLGSDLQQRTTQGHHFTVTTWWRLPGPMSEDLNFFLHAERDGIREPYDHVPGDWMYPADRWREGEILEDRTLFQLSPSLPPGTYEVYIGAYEREDQNRLEVVSGAAEESDRIRLGTVEVEPFRPFLDHLIRPTDVEEQRKYPGRISPHGE